MIAAKYLNLFSHTVWAIHPEARRGLLAAVPELLDAAAGAGARQAAAAPKMAAVEGGNAAAGKVGVLKISGPILKGISPQEAAYYGACSIDIIHEAAAQVQAQGINHLILHLDSPGGMVLGIAEAADRLGQLRASGVTLTAYTDTLACSAAYWLAAACNEIVAAPSAIVGSIGCICLCTDTSGLWEKFGVKPEYFVSEGSDAKLYGRGGQPWTDEMRASYQESVDQVGAEFKAFLGARRPGIASADMNGHAWDAANAPAGYVDHMHAPTADGGKRPISTLADLLGLLGV